MRKSFQHILYLSFTAAVLLLTVGLFLPTSSTPQSVRASSSLQETQPTQSPEEKEEQVPAPRTPVDHSQFEILEGSFESGPEVTKACLSCHTEAAKEIQDSSHWTWTFEHPDTGQTLGKSHTINNFCIGVTSNEPRCTSCHAGYGWEDDSFDFSQQENVDCLVCHDTTGTYKKFPTGAGHPAYEPQEFPPGSGNIWQPPDLSEVAQQVGPTSRSTCGSCHFYGGGGDGVKHGDMDSSLAEPDHNLDVHMDAEGLDFTCTTCHTSDGHQLKGSRYAMNSTDEQTCETCHTSSPHDYQVLDQHVERISCQTCHIPTYARGGVPTKTAWDWSQAGDLNPDGSLKINKNQNGQVVFDSRKGAFEWGENLVPDYIWFNGTVEYTQLNDPFPEQEVLTINPPQGSRDDEQARIWPMKVFRGIQPYDSGNQTLVIPHLFGKEKDAYWKGFDWQKAITSGMESANAPYSGEYGFIETEMYWPITHMVAPADQALTCQDCHSENGRLDYRALGYSKQASQGLTNFPPRAGLGTISTTSSAPEDCATCHQDQASQWENSAHGEHDVGCVSCHKLQGEGDHPPAPYSTSHESNVCGACHLDEHRDWENSDHASTESGKDPISCIACHQPHNQQQRITDHNQTSCESCHQQEARQMPDSTHAEEGLTCVDCHKETEVNTGHTFHIQSDSCSRCHGAEIHESDKLLSRKREVTTPVPAGDRDTDFPTSTPVEGRSKGANIRVPSWGFLGLGLVLGVIAFWLIFGKEPGSTHNQNTLEEKEDQKEE